MDSPITVFGPIGVDESTGDAQSFELYNVDTSSFNASTETNQESIPGRDSDEAILTPLTGSVDRSIDGRGSPLALEMGVGSGSVQNSLRTWIYGFEALVLPQQGLGYDIQSDVRSGNYDPRDSESGFLIEEARWNLTSTDISTFDWNLSFVLSEGVQQIAKTPQEYIDEQDADSASVDKVEVGGLEFEFDEVQDRSVSRSIDINAVDLMHQTDIPLSGVMESGVEMEVSFSGRVINRDVADLADEVRDFDQELQGEEATIFDSFTDRTFTGAISSSNTDLNAGQPNAFDFSIELDVGETFGTG